MPGAFDTQAPRRWSARMGATARALTRRQRGSSDSFLAWTGAAERGVDVGVADIDLPIRYWRTDCFMGVFAADQDAVRELLPSRRLRPVRLHRGHVAVAVVAYNYLETSVGPYGEVGISPLCTLDRDAPPVLGLADGYRHGFSGFVAHLPVTSRVAREAGRRIWGYPKFVADMAFEALPERQAVTLSEKGREILRLEVRRAGRVALERTPLTTFTVLNGELIRTTVPTRGYVATAPAGGELALGDHPVGRSLADLGLGATPLATRTYLTHTAILPVGEGVGPSQRAYRGHRGDDREFGDHTVRYDDGVIRVISESGSPSLVGAAEQR